tara:strand:+ start:13457 stop:15205 length:1749 start_codon:yes stop_codon:yes gene_type:complete
MAINLNPGADSSIVSAATRAGLASGPGDYSKQFQAIADAYGETMDASVALNKQIMDATLTLAGDSIKNAGERRRAEIALEDTPGGEKLLAKIDGYKDELKKTRGLSIEVEIEDEAAYEVAMNELSGEGVEDVNLPSYEEWKGQTQKTKKVKQNPYSKENRKKRRQIYKEYNALAREVASMGAGLKVINELQASGDFDAIATNADGIEMAEAFASSQTGGGPTKGGHYFESDWDPKKKKIVHTLMNTGEGNIGIPKGVVMDIDGTPKTYTTEQISNFLIPKDDSLVGDYNKIFADAEKNGKTLGTQYDDYQANKYKKQIESLVSTTAGLHRSLDKTFGHLDKSFREEFTSISELSSKEFMQLKNILPNDGKGNLMKTGVLTEINDMADGTPGIQQTDFATKENMAKLQIAMFNKRSPYYNERKLRESFVNWVAGKDGKLARAHNYGTSYNPNVIRQNQVNQQLALEADKTGLPTSIIKAFPSGTNYGTIEKNDGSTVSITGDTFRDLYKRFKSGVLKTKNDTWKLDTKKGYWESKKGQIRSGIEMLKMFQPPKGPSLLTSTGFAEFRTDKKGGLPFQWSFPTK